MTTFGKASLYQDHITATVAPTVNDDINLGFTVGSTWFNSTSATFYRCTSNASGAATWQSVTAGTGGGETLLGSIIGANFNITTDQPFVGAVNLTAIKYAITRFLVTNCSASITTAVGGIYSAATKGGTPIVAAAQTYTGTGATSLQSLTIAAAGSASAWSIVPILSLTTAEGSAATADVTMYGIPVT
jgi:hypothetical protein